MSRVYDLCKIGLFPLSRVIDRVSYRNYKKLDEDIFVARSHTWSQSSRAGGRPSHFQASLDICWWWASANVIFSWLLFYWLRISAWLATGLMLPHIRQLQLSQLSPEPIGLKWSINNKQSVIADQVLKILSLVFLLSSSWETHHHHHLVVSYLGFGLIEPSFCSVFFKYWDEWLLVPFPINPNTQVHRKPG